MSTRQNKNIAIVFASIDGVIGSHSGTGTITQQFISIMPLVAKNFRTRKVELDFFAITLAVAKKYALYSEANREKTEEVCRTLNGKLFLINHSIDHAVNNGPSLDIPAHWDDISEKSADIVLSLASRHDEVIVYMIGLPFLKIPTHINTIDEKLTKKVKLVVLSYSDYFLFKNSPYKEHVQWEDESFKQINLYENTSHKEHVQWEDESFKQINLYENTYMAATSNYQIGLLKKQYRLSQRKIKPLKSGLNFSDETFKQIPKLEIIKRLKSINIPVDVDLIFSVGRAASYKGFRELLFAFSELIRLHNKPVHLVFVTSNFVPFPSLSVIEQLKQIISDNHLEKYCTPIYHYDLDLPRHVLQWENTKIVAQLSLQESFGLVPEEARISPNKKGPIVVASNLGGFKEQITNGKDGFLVDPHNYLKTAKTMSAILNMPEPELSKIRKAGLVRAKKDYDYTKNVIESLESLVE